MKPLIAFASLVVLALAACSSPTPAPEPAKEVVVPELAKLQAAAAQYAPTEIGADLSKLPANEQQALAKLVQAGWIMDALFLRQAWAGNEGMLLNLLTDRSPLGQARTHYFLLNKGPWDRLAHNEPFIAGAPVKPEGANFYPAGATKADIEAWLKALPEPERARATGFFTTIRRPVATKGGKAGFEIVPYSVEYQGELARAADLLREAAALTAQPTLEGLPDEPGRRLPQQRLLRERRGVDGARREHRADDRAVRGLRGRVVQCEGRLRGVHRRARRRGDGEAGEAGRGAAGDRGQPADRREAAQSEARRDGAHPRRQRRAGRRRRQPRRADGGLQPAERRAGGEGEGRQARHAAEHPGGEVQARAHADRGEGAHRGAAEERPVRRLLHAHRHARADARPRAAPDQGGRQGHDRARAAEGDLQRDGGGEGRHLRPLRAAAADRQGRSRQGDGRSRCTTRSWRRRSARSGSA